MSLVRFSRQGDPYIDLANKIRHIYDIHLMLINNELKAFIKNEAFEKMLIKVREDDVIGYKNDHEWLAEHPVKALIFERPEETWHKIKTAYQTTFRELVIGELPEERDLIKTLKKVSERLKHIDWSIKM